MNDIGILVVEDDVLIALDIEMMIEKLGHKFLGTFKDGDSALEGIKRTKPDLIIMDIHIEGTQNGIEVAEHIVAEQIPLIFITASLDNANYERAKKTKPAAYLIKPLQPLALQSAIELALIKTDEAETSDDDSNSWSNYVSKNGVVFIRLNNVLYKVYVADIIWVQSDGNYSYIHTMERKYVLKISLKKILEKINVHADFIRVHKQFIVQTKYIKSVNSPESTLLIESETVPIGRTFKKDLMKQLNLLKG